MANAQGGGAPGGYGGGAAAAYGGYPGYPSPYGGGYPGYGGYPAYGGYPGKDVRGAQVEHIRLTPRVEHQVDPVALLNTSG